jgi:hypothetical protein
MECPYHPSFVIINLVSQALAFERFAQGWTEEQILAYLRGQGKLEWLDYLPGKKVYRFESGVGFVASFFFDEGQFIFLGDHTTFRPK